MIDLNQRGKLERAIVIALRSAIEAHGPITSDNASSAAKRVIGAIKQYNKEIQKIDDGKGIKDYDYETEGYGGT